MISARAEYCGNEHDRGRDNRDPPKAAESGEKPTEV
jgi:hypothetical protein